MCMYLQENDTQKAMTVKVKIAEVSSHIKIVRLRLQKGWRWNTEDMISIMLINFVNISEKGDIKTKTEALKKTIQQILNGEKLPSLLMTIIRFVMPIQDHMIKKLLLIFWEVVPKYTPDGKMLHEMILVCDAYRKVSGEWVMLYTFCSTICTYYIFKYKPVPIYFVSFLTNGKQSMNTFREFVLKGL